MPGNVCTMAQEWSPRPSCAGRERLALRATGRRRIAIVGGGIGGLTAAVALAKCPEFEVFVFERSHASVRGGAAVLLWANAVRALATLGIEDALLRQSSVIETTEFRDPRGGLLCSLPVGEWSRRNGSPTVAIRRWDLLRLLFDSLPRGLLRTGAAFRSCSREDDRIAVNLEGGSRLEVDALVGADGLRSAVRGQLFGDQPPRAVGQDAWVGISPRCSPGMVSGVTVATVGQGPRFWAAPLTDGAAFWYATINRSPGSGRRSRAELLQTFREWRGPMSDLIASTPAQSITETEICDRAPLDRWGDGGITLLGDAAHPSTPDLGQGACQAIESAVTLAHCLRGCASIPEGLRSYERKRAPRTATISRLCWLTAKSSTVEDPLRCGLRDAGMRLGLKAVARSHLEWILAGGAP